MSDTTVQARSGTGHYLVLFHQDRMEAGIRHLSELAQLRIQHWSEDGVGALDESRALVFDHIGVAFVRCSEPARARLVGAAADGESILAVEPERIVHAIGVTPVTPGSPAARPEERVSWGIHAVGAGGSTLTGQGIRIAVLDTGLDLSHPDFAGRSIESRSFVAGQPVQDGNGHGTHCAGIAAGPRDPEGGTRYGVAGEAGLYIGKVLGDDGSGGDGGILEGINWAVAQGCDIVSMSLGSPVEPGQSYSRVFEEVAKRALAAGTLIVAAAGNDSQRPDSIAPVGHPANCPSIMAVAAVDQNLNVAPFSSGGLQGDGGEVNLAAPGVDVLSSWPGNELYRSLSGTSMATPFVAGVAALHAQQDPQVRAARLAVRLVDGAQALRDPPRDVGTGLVRAPDIGQEGL
ncbi:S8 family serine peptidase [Castellaniella sp.]|uniref:S8 family serine peptidase n=1 Tax=Castellaniella sp. TaxID=1955812 RepID=UPI002AFEFF9E|nr:S8 family serine peptidase [Castellaniella sp.]